MKKSVLVVLGILVFAILAFGVSNLVSSVGEVSYCCEKTTDGAWCQDITDVSECDTGSGFNSPVPTSCEATSYCKLGTCINGEEGTCLPNTPQRVCEENNGLWDGKDIDDIPQCQLGCCLIGDQAAFVTNAGCERLSFLYGIENEFRINIQDIEQCLAIATPHVKGACVLESDITRTCRFLTRNECLDLETQSSETTTEFYEGLLCSAESLFTNCGPTQKTTCKEGKEEVYFVDSCGNLANIYDASKINNQDYWTHIKKKSESCGFEESNANSVSCGNCDYFLGSTCKPYKRGDSQTVNPTYGDNVCADLSCKYKGETYEHGERWCVGDAGFEGDDLPGSESYRLLCYDGDVTSELCAPYRQKICIPSEIDGFKVAGCRLNRWRECHLNDNLEDCENEEERDCVWLEGESVFRDDDGYKLIIEEGDNSLVEQEKDDKGRLEDKEGEEVVGATCVPKYAPGFDFWAAGETAETQCRFADDLCVAKYTKTLLGAWKCVENCWCVDDNGKTGEGNIDEDWVESRNQLCTSLGDCGSSENYLGREGYHELEDLYNIKIVKSQEELEEILGG